MYITNRAVDINFQLHVNGFILSYIQSRRAQETLLSFQLHAMDSVKAELEKIPQVVITFNSMQWIHNEVVKQFMEELAKHFQLHAMDSERLKGNSRFYGELDFQLHAMDS